MKEQGYSAVNSEQTIFMKWVGQDFIIHGLFVDDMQHTSTCKALMDEFMAKYSRDFEITGGELMGTFLGLQVDHLNDEIHLHMDTYIQGVLDEYKAFARKTLRPKKLPIAPNYQLPPSDADQKLMDKDPKFFRSFVMKLQIRLQYVATWV
jgi:hypothetical protein